MKKYEKNVAPDQVFYLNNGQVLNNLKELYMEMGRMPDDVFFHHVNAEKNDFSTWVNDVMGDKKLSAKIAKAGTPVMLKEVLGEAFTTVTTAAKKTTAVKSSPAKPRSGRKAN